MSRILTSVGTVLAALALGLTGVVTAATSASAAARVTSQATHYTHAQLVARANQLEFSYSLSHFIRVRNHHSGIDNSFNWGTDGCSSTPAAVAAFFRRSCIRHDFGYRNYGHGLNLGYSEASKARIDDRLLVGMQGECKARDNHTTCYDEALIIYNVVHRAGAAYTAFYARTCPNGHFCLFDDAGYADRRKALTVSHKDLGTLDFNDKTSSLKNYTKVSWVIYDDHYSDRSFCIKPGVKVPNLDRYGFGDKTSSARRLSGTACPKGSAIIAS